MNREQAQHILDAYAETLNIHELNDALGIIISDAMTDDGKAPVVPNITYPSYPITKPTTTPWTEPYKPTITCHNDVTKVVGGMKEGKPCPYCGGETAAHQLEGEMWVAGCDDPFCRGHWDGSPVSGCAEVAVNLANRRYERTWSSRDDNCFECSECGFLDAYMDTHFINYCPECGARIENDD